MGVLNIHKLENTMAKVNAFDQWMVRMNLVRAENEKVLSDLRMNGYLMVADDVERQFKDGIRGIQSEVDRNPEVK
mgnify:CR=1 FL=1